MENLYDKYKAVPVYDAQADPNLSEARKAACVKDYDDMGLHDIDKIFQSAYKYGKDGKPQSKKPRSVHELIYNLIQRVKRLEAENGM